jgi:hypothetical protein
MNPLSIVAPYSPLTFIENLPGYNNNWQTDEMLDLMREILESGNYYWIGVNFPTGGDTTIPALGTVNGSVQVPAGSYVVSMNYFCDPGTSLSPINPGGIKLKLWDKGSKASIFYGDYALDRTVMSNMQLEYGVGNGVGPSDPGSNADTPFGAGLLLSPFIVTPPGVLNWEIVNLDTNANGAVVQVLLSIAVPINANSIGMRKITR